MRETLVYDVSDTKLFESRKTLQTMKEIQDSLRKKTPTNQFGWGNGSCTTGVDHEFPLEDSGRVWWHGFCSRRRELVDRKT